MPKLKIGDKAPHFSAPDQNGEIHTLEQYSGKKIVLYFYPKDSTPGCTAEACNLRDNYEQLQAAGYSVIGVSADSINSHKRFADKQNLPFTILSDEEKKMLEAYDAWGMKKLYGKEYMGIIRKTFIIDQNGIITDIIEKVNTKEHTTQILK
ncbi:MAG: thioredoxin-dependent thiol peroxidase [Bacteroidales bacterium]